MRYFRIKKSRGRKTATKSWRHDMEELQSDVVSLLAR